MCWPDVFDALLVLLYRVGDTCLNYDTYPLVNTDFGT